MIQAIEAEALKEALRKMFRENPTLLERTFQASQGLASTVRGAALVEEHAGALAAIPEQFDEIATPILLRLSKLQRFPNFPPRIPFTPLARIPVSYSDEAISPGSRDRRQERAPDPVPHATIVAALRSRRLERGDETRKVLRRVIREVFPDVTGRNFQAGYSEVYQRNRRGAPRKNN